MVDRLTFYFKSKKLDLNIFFDKNTCEIWLRTRPIGTFLNINDEEILNNIIDINIATFDKIEKQVEKYKEIPKQTLFINTYGFYQLVVYLNLKQDLKLWLLSKVYNTVHYYCSSSSVSLSTALSPPKQLTQLTRLSPEKSSNKSLIKFDRHQKSQKQQNQQQSLQQLRQNNNFLFNVYNSIDPTLLSAPSVLSPTILV